MQVAWEELYPFVDKEALLSAEAPGLPEDAGKLAKLVDKRDFTELVAALVRVRLKGEREKVLTEANGS